MNLWQHKIEENKWEVTQWATNPDSLAGLQSSLVAESKIEHWHSELRCWLLTPGNLSFKMAPDPRRQHLGREWGGRLFAEKMLSEVFCVWRCFGWEHDADRGVGEDAWAIIDWLLPPSKAAPGVKVKQHPPAELCFRGGWGLQQTGRAQLVRCSFTSRHEPPAPLGVSQILHVGEIRQAQQGWDTCSAGKERWDQHHVPHYLWLPSKVPTRHKELATNTDSPQTPSSHSTRKRHFHKTLC